MERSFIYCSQGKRTMPPCHGLLSLKLNVPKLSLSTSKNSDLLTDMGAMPSAYIFQEAMNRLMEGLGDVLTYLDDVLCVTKGDFEVHLQRLKLCLQRLHKAGLQVNLPKSEFATQQFKYLGYLVLHQGICRSDSAVETPKNFETITLIPWHAQLLP
ncbi:unnamed protein product [Cylindrotheca closterium]|uniref:Reverse transcriptase domain-containing protein n=1 Tax=Cylindrotheca closterium TaxID=2856 RepID=A0AAD2CRP8_9STRA|nr:unnamed protein product [Cylindrotheca closterium]